MKLWTFKGYVDNNNLNVFDEWYKELPPKAQSKVDWIVKLFESRPFINWGAKHIKKLEGDIYEVRFEINRICYRPLGAISETDNSFIFLIGVIKKNNRLIPESAEMIASRRFDEIRQQPNKARECDFDNE